MFIPRRNGNSVVLSYRLVAPPIQEAHSYRWPSQSSYLRVQRDSPLNHELRPGKRSHSDKTSFHKKMPPKAAGPKAGAKAGAPLGKGHGKGGAAPVAPPIPPPPAPAPAVHPADTDDSAEKPGPYAMGFSNWSSYAAKQGLSLPVFARVGNKTPTFPHIVTMSVVKTQLKNRAIPKSDLLRRSHEETADRL